MSGSASSSMRETVVFPAPKARKGMNIKPRRRSASSLPCALLAHETGRIKPALGGRRLFARFFHGFGTVAAALAAVEQGLGEQPASHHQSTRDGPRSQPPSAAAAMRLVKLALGGRLTFPRSARSPPASLRWTARRAVSDPSRKATSTISPMV